MLLQGLLAVSVALVPLADDEIAWRTSFPDGLAEAEASGRPVLVYFWLDGSRFCEQLYADTLTTERGAKELSHFVCIGVQVGPEAGRELVQRFNVSTLPTLVFLDAKGRAEDAIEGFIALDGFLAESQRIRRGEQTVSDWREKAAAAPDDLDVRLRLALQLEHVGLLDESNRLQASIKAEDPDGLTVAGAQLHLYDVFALVRNSASDASDSRTYDLAPLYEHMPRVKPAAVCHEGWVWIADVESQRGDRSRERTALARIWSYAAPGTQRFRAGQGLLRRYLELESELSADERRLTLDVAEGLAKEIVDSEMGVAPANVHRVRAVALAINGEHERAQRELERAMELDPAGKTSDEGLLERLRALGR